MLLLLALALGVMPLLADGPAPPAFPPDDGFDPGTFLMIVFTVGLFVLLLCLAMIAAVVVCIWAGVATAAGVLGSSVAVGCFRRSPASGIRVLLVELGSIAGIPCGILAVWLFSWLAHIHWSVLSRVLVGGAGGLACGIACGFLAAWPLGARRPKLTH
jgi:hypothetical protein